MLWIKLMSTSWKMDLKWMPQNTFNDQSTLVQAIAWCHQATQNYPSQCWQRSMSLKGVTRPQWAKYFLEHDDIIKWNIFRVTGLLCEEFTVHRRTPLTKASVMLQSLNQQLSKQWGRQWFEVSLNSLSCRLCNEISQHHAHWCPGPFLTTATWCCHKNFSQWERSFLWKLSCHWLKGLRQRQIAAVRVDPGYCCYRDVKFIVYSYDPA